MEVFYPVFGFVAAICAGVIILTVFFTSLKWLNGSLPGSGDARFNGLIREGKWLNVQMTGGRNLERVRFSGVLSSHSTKEFGIPFQIANMMVFETEQGNRVMVRAELIRLIEEVD